MFFKKITVHYCNLPKNGSIEQICMETLNFVYILVFKFVHPLTWYLTIFTRSTACLSCLMGLLPSQQFNSSVSVYAELLNILLCFTMTEKEMEVLIAV